MTQISETICTQLVLHRITLGRCYCKW